MLVIGGCTYSHCTSYLKNALLWVSDTLPDYESYTKDFDDFTKRQFDALPEGSPHRPLLYISTDDSFVDYYRQFEPPLSVKYIHIKLISPHVHEANTDESLETEKKIEGNGGEKNEEQKAAEGMEPGDEEKKEEGKLVTTIDITKKIDLEFIGLWGNPDPIPPKRVIVSTKNLYAALGGRVDTDEEFLGARPEGSVANQVDISPVVAEFLNAVKSVADGQPLPTAAKDLNITEKDVDEVLKLLNFVEPEAGGTHLNQARILFQLNPVIHLFRLFYGYPAEEILQKTM